MHFSNEIMKTMILTQNHNPDVKIHFWMQKCNFTQNAVLHPSKSLIFLMEYWWLARVGPEWCQKALFAPKGTFGPEKMENTHFNAFCSFSDISLISARLRENVVFLVVYWWFWSPKSHKYTFCRRKLYFEWKSWKWAKIIIFTQKLDFVLFEHILRKSKIP